MAPASLVRSKSKDLRCPHRQPSGSMSPVSDGGEAGCHGADGTRGRSSPGFSFSEDFAEVKLSPSHIVAPGAKGKCPLLSAHFPSPDAPVLMIRLSQGNCTGRSHSLLSGDEGVGPPLPAQAQGLEVTPSSLALQPPAVGLSPAPSPASHTQEATIAFGSSLFPF